MISEDFRKHEIEMNSSPDDTASTLVGAYLEEMKRSRAHGSNDSFQLVYESFASILSIGAVRMQNPFLHYMLCRMINFHPDLITSS